MSNEIVKLISNESERQIYRKFALSMPFDVVGFGKDLGISIRETEKLPAKVSGFIKQTNGTTSICVNKLEPLPRKRFTVAHELGHYFLHSERLADGIVDALNRDGTVDPIENEANNFAANLLMPELTFRELWMKENCSIDHMARYFFVSESAILTRARFLHLANENSSYFA